MIDPKDRPTVNTKMVQAAKEAGWTKDEYFCRKYMYKMTKTKA